MSNTKFVLKPKFKRILFKIKIIFILVLFVLISIFVIKMFYTPVKNITIKNNILKIELRKNYECIFTNQDVNLDSKWIESKDKVCEVKYIKNGKLYLKNKDKIIDPLKHKLYIEFNNSETIYLANDEEYDYFKYIVGNKNKLGKIKYDKNIISIDENGTIKGIKNGETVLVINYKNTKITSKIIVTNIITKRPSDGFDYNKDKLTCNKYSKEENDLLDKILKTKIENVGYKTRAGVVEAARFLTLDFPYRINYFYENGRLTTNSVDGEGRYYHTGLYLNSSRFDNISYSIKSPQIWGCLLYSNPVKKEEYNGLDCSGFVSWALLNGGFDVEDVGAGWSDEEDLTDFGEVKLINDELIKSNSIKVGDLLHSEASGGHIGIIVGDDGDNYYVAQAIWYDTVGVIITKIKKEKLSSSFPHVVLMDKYYIEDGNLTNMW